jgi:hypothetical protein
MISTIALLSAVATTAAPFPEANEVVSEPSFVVDNNDGTFELIGSAADGSIESDGRFVDAVSGFSILHVEEREVLEPNNIVDPISSGVEIIGEINEQFFFRREWWRRAHHSGQ